MRKTSVFMALALCVIPGFAQIVVPPVIADSFSISGTVTTGRATVVPGVKVYLKTQIYYILMKAAAPSDPYTIIVDSTTTNQSGAYAFRNKMSDSYTLRFAKSGYLTEDTIVYLTRDTVINANLAAGVDPVPLKGTVTRTVCPENPFSRAACLIQPIAGCTVTVMGSYYLYPIDIMAPIVAPRVYARTITDAQGSYAFPDLVMNPTEYVTITARAPGYLPQTVDTSISSSRETTIDFSLLVDYPNAASKTIDSVLYAFAVDKKEYTVGGWLRARYSVTNNKRDTIRMTWGSCDFDMAVADTRGRQIYQYLDNRPCPMMYVEKAIAPGETALFDSYEPWQIPTGYDTLVVTGVPVAVPKAALSVGIRITGATQSARNGIARPAASALAASRGNVLLTLDRARTLTATTISPDGSVIPLFTNRTFAPGTHAFALNVRTRGVAIVRVSGDGMSETCRIVSGR